MRPGEAQRARRELGRHLVGGMEAGEVVGMEADRELVGHEAAPSVGAALGVHRALDPAQDLDRLESGPEEAGARALHEALEEALHA